MALQRRVLVLWDSVAERPRGMTHRTDCSWAVGVSNKYRAPGPVQWEILDVERIPQRTGRCSRCGGGR